MRIFLKAGIIFSLIVVSIRSIPVYSATQQTGNAFFWSSIALPSRTIKYSDQSAPAWKKRWDSARAYFGERKFKLAQKQYELLLQDKNNVELARWEFVNLLIQQKKMGKSLYRACHIAQSCSVQT